MAADDRSDQTEMRFYAPTDQVSVIDAVALATGGDRTSVMRSLIREMVEREIHRATVVLRVARINPLAMDTERKAGGNVKNDNA